MHMSVTVVTTTLVIIVFLFAIPRLTRAVFAFGEVIKGMWDFYMRDIRLVSARPQKVDEMVGDSTAVFLRLEHKPRLQYSYDLVAGTFTVSSTGTGYTLDPVSGSIVTTGALPEMETIAGVSPGGGTVSVKGVATTGATHGGLDIQVTIFESWLDYFARAAKDWHDPFFTGWTNNLVGGTKCEGWAAWMELWIKAHAKGRVCKLEEVTFPKNWFGSNHVCVRVTMCPDGPVYYLDPWRFGPDKPAMGKDDYEKKFGKPMPEGSIDIPLPP
jgi:hypothetical protein